MTENTNQLKPTTLTDICSTCQHINERNPELSHDSQAEPEIWEAYLYSGACAQKVIIQKRKGEETHLRISNRMETEVLTGRWETPVSLTCNNERRNKNGDLRLYGQGYIPASSHFPLLNNPGFIPIWELRKKSSWSSHSISCPVACHSEQAHGSYFYLNYKKYSAKNPCFKGVY